MVDLSVIAQGGTGDDKRKIAVHEAGHLVAHMRLGIDQEGATIVPKNMPGGRRAGAVVAAGVEHVWNKEEAGPMVLAFCAGYAAVVAAGYSDDDARTGTGDDFEQAAHLIDYWGLPGDLESWLPQAVELMRRPENVVAVTLVARHLLRHQALDSDYLGALVDLADGKITEAEFVQYLQFAKQGGAELQSAADV